MRKLHVFASAMIVLFLVASCGLTGNGFGGNSIQKRKYTKGFYLNKNRSYRGQDSETAKIDLKESNETVETALDETITPLKVRSVESSLVAEPNSIKDEKKQQPQRQEEKKKKSVSPSRKEVKSTTRQRKIRENEYYIPVKASVKEWNSAASSSDTGMLILLVILALLIPPLAVFIYEGATSRFWIDLILAIIGIGVGVLLFGAGLAWLCALAAVIYALLIVLEVI